MTALRPPLVPHPAIAALDATAEKRHTPCGDGQMIWRQWGSGPPLVMFHGGTGSWMHWLRNIGPLARHHSVLIPDLPGFGDSDYPTNAGGPFEPNDLPEGQRFTGRPPSPIPMALFTRIMCEGLDLVLPREPVPIVGFSFGGMLAANVAAAIPERVDRLILVGSGGIPGDRPDRPEMTAWRHLTDPAKLAAVQRKNLEVHMFADPRRIDEVAVSVQTLNTRNSRSRRVARTLSVFPSLAHARARIGGIWGRHDHTAKGRIDELPGLLRGIDPTADFHVIEDGGHWVAYECADEFNRVLLRFLRTTGSGRQ